MLSRVCVCKGLKLFGLLAYSCQCVKIQFYGEQLISSNASPQKRCVNCTSMGVLLKELCSSLDCLSKCLVFWSSAHSSTCALDN